MKLFLIGLLTLNSISTFANSDCSLQKNFGKITYDLFSKEYEVRTRLEKIVSKKFNLVSKDYEYQILDTSFNCNVTIHTMAGDDLIRGCEGKVYLKNVKTGVLFIIPGKRGGSKNKAERSAFRAIPNCLKNGIGFN